MCQEYRYNGEQMDQNKALRNSSGTLSASVSHLIELGSRGILELEFSAFCVSKDRCFPHPCRGEAEYFAGNPLPTEPYFLIFDGEGEACDEWTKNRPGPQSQLDPSSSLKSH